MKRSIVAVTITSFVSLAGCAGMMKSMTPKPRVVDNPLVSGQPLEAKHKGDVGVVSQDDCNTWPFEDTLTVRVTEAQICIEARNHKEQPPGWTGEPTADSSKGFSIANDANEGGRINADKAGSAKVGSCFNRGYNKQVEIWAFDYKACAPNNGTVTAATKSLRVGDESWDFAGSQPATTAAAPASSTGS